MTSVSTAQTTVEKHEKIKINEKLEAWDEAVKNDPQYTVHYVNNIFNELKLQEVLYFILQIAKKIFISLGRKYDKSFIYFNSKRNKWQNESNSDRLAY